MKTFYKVLAILLGYGLIIAGFIVFGTSMADNVRILDIVVSCLIFTQFVEFLFVPLVNLGKKAHKEVGMIGIHLTSVYIYIMVSIIIMVVGVLLDLPFIWQLLLQLGALFILVVGRVATLHVGDKVEGVYQREQTIVGAKMQMKTAMETVMDAVALNGIRDAAVVDRLRELAENVRYVSPSVEEDARNLESQFTSVAAELIVMMRDEVRNKDRIPETIERLDYILAKRKKY